MESLEIIGRSPLRMSLLKALRVSSNGEKLSCFLNCIHVPSLISLDISVSHVEDSWWTQLPSHLRPMGLTLQELIIRCITFPGKDLLASLLVVPNLTRLAIKTSINVRTPAPLLSNLADSDRPIPICPRLRQLEYEGSELDLEPRPFSDLMKTRWVNANEQDGYSRLKCLVLSNMKQGQRYSKRTLNEDLDTEIYR